MKRREFIKQAALGAAAVCTSTIPSASEGLTIDKLRRAKAALDEMEKPGPVIYKAWESETQVCVFYCDQGSHGVIRGLTMEKIPNAWIGVLELGFRKIVFSTNGANQMQAVLCDAEDPYVPCVPRVDGGTGERIV